MNYIFLFLVPDALPLPLPLIVPPVLPFLEPMLLFIDPVLPFLEPILPFIEPMLPLDIEPLLFDIVPPLVLLPMFAFDVVVDELVVVVVELVVAFVLPVLVLSVAQPLQKAATASKAKRAKVLRIEFSPVTLRVSSLRVVWG
jgi:hypothetical protein